MNSKTPQFDKALDEILKALTPHVRECIQKNTFQYCEKKFDITNEDIKFLKLLRVPPPENCPTCRRHKRLSFFSWTRFFQRSCNAPEHDEKVISSFPPNCPFSVVDIPYYQSSDFIPTLAGFAPDETKSFWSQLYELRKHVPLPAIVQEASNVNAEYSMGGRSSKNVYYSTGVFYSEDVLYSNGVLHCQECLDVFFTRKSSRVYEAIKSDRITNSSYVYFSQECIDSKFLFNCRNCTDCFGCVNLRNRRFCFFNEQLSREAYMEKLKSLNTGSRDTLRALLERFWLFVKSQPVRATQNLSSKDVKGVYIKNSRDCKNVFDATGTEHARHSQGLLSHSDSMDVTISGASHHLYETANVGSQSSAVKFSAVSKFVTESEFLLNCRNCQNCFGCVGLENKSYHILNIPYEPDEYWDKVDRIKFTMLKRGEYGRGVPISFSPFAYNITLASVTFPLTPEAVKKLGGYTQDETESNVGNLPTLKIEQVPPSIDKVQDSVLQKAILSEYSGRPFKIVPQELAFYRRYRLPIPIFHPYERMDSRAKIFGCYKLYETTCARCKKATQSVFDPTEGFTLYCDECYNAEVV
jgi:CxxC-x17-CxxC domain-containing protein